MTTKRIAIIAPALLAAAALALQTGCAESKRHNEAALMEAARQDSVKDIAGILERGAKAGADINARDQNGSALTRAAVSGAIDASRLLLERGADANVTAG
jgi:ankyrin repeat protein